MRPTFRKLEVKDIGNLEALVAENIEGIEEGLMVIDSRLMLGNAAIDLVGLDARSTLVLIALDFTSDESLLLRVMDAYSWCLEYSESLRRLYPTAKISPSQPPRILFIVQRLTETFLRRIKQLSALEIDCLEFRHLEVNGAPGVYFDLVERLRRATLTEVAAAEPLPAPQPPPIDTLPAAAAAKDGAALETARIHVDATVRTSGTRNASGAEGANPAAAAPVPQPGEWETFLSQLGLDGPNPEVAAAPAAKAEPVAAPAPAPVLECLREAPAEPLIATAPARPAVTPTVSEAPSHKTVTRREPIPAPAARTYLFADATKIVAPVPEPPPPAPASLIEAEAAVVVPPAPRVEPPVAAVEAPAPVPEPAPAELVETVEAERAVEVAAVETVEIVSLATPSAPVVEVEQPVAETEPAVVEVTQPVVMTEPAVVAVTQPVVAVKPAVVEAKRPVVAVKPAVVEAKRPVVATKPAVVETKQPAAQTEPAPTGRAASAPAPEVLKGAQRLELESLSFPQDGLSRQWLEFLNQLGATK